MQTTLHYFNIKFSLLEGQRFSWYWKKRDSYIHCKSVIMYDAVLTNEDNLQLCKWQVSESSKV